MYGIFITLYVCKWNLKICVLGRMKLGQRNTLTILKMKNTYEQQIETGLNC